MSALEIAAVVTSFLAIWLTAARRMLCWPINLLACALYFKLFLDVRLYADMVLQRQLIAALARPDHFAYSQEELLAVLAGAENAEAEGRELERRAKLAARRQYRAAVIAQPRPRTAREASRLGALEATQ